MADVGAPAWTRAVESSRLFAEARLFVGVILSARQANSAGTERVIENPVSTLMG